MNLEEKKKDKVENVKQQVQEIQSLFQYSIKPHRNHTLYELDLVNFTIVEAVFDETPPVRWEDAVKGNIALNKRITKKPNCIYISALNKVNAIKILNRVTNGKIQNTSFTNIP